VTLAIVGASLVALGYAALLTAPLATPRLLTLVRPSSSLGASALLGSAGVSWDWEKWLSPARVWTLVVGLACAGWGVGLSEGVFVGAGGLALLAWAFVFLWDSARRFVSVPACVLLEGLLTLGIATALDRHWVQVVALLTLRSF
jgi:hypothetical protein